jgi:pyridinium-3,5-biscarboxylic acid mononucleotide synthase
MDRDDLRSMLERLSLGELAVDEVAEAVARLPYSDLGFARVDHHRHVRQGMPEAVYAPGKSPEQCAAIVAELLQAGTGPVLLTRANHAQARAALDRCPGATLTDVDATGTLQLLTWRAAPHRGRRVAVVTAGTADLPVARECLGTLAAYGLDAALVADCGVAGLHRLLAAADEVTAAEAVVVVAGMEGALASVVAGLTAAPVIAVPTSVGYGSSLEGITALLAMHASCAPGVVVVGIDNGYGAACALARVLR